MKYEVKKLKLVVGKVEDLSKVLKGMNDELKKLKRSQEDVHGRAVGTSLFDEVAKLKQEVEAGANFRQDVERLKQRLNSLAKSSNYEASRAEAAAKSTRRDLRCVKYEIRRIKRVPASPPAPIAGAAIEREVLAKLRQQFEKFCQLVDRGLRCVKYELRRRKLADSAPVPGRQEIPQSIQDDL
jgi:DNA repair exonuclease SbcCD ATPase subunit